MVGLENYVHYYILTTQNRSIWFQFKVDFDFYDMKLK